jgi:hypothetical protein
MYHVSREFVWRTEIVLQREQESWPRGASVDDHADQNALFSLGYLYEPQTSGLCLDISCRKGLGFAREMVPV